MERGAVYTATVIPFIGYARECGVRRLCASHFESEAGTQHSLSACKAHEGEEVNKSGISAAEGARPATLTSPSTTSAGVDITP